MNNFYERVYAVVSKIPKGKITTYKLVAEALKTKAYRLVGNALNKNPYKNVPCHRVINSNGFVGGYARGTKEKIKMLKKEGILIKNKRVVNFKDVLFKPKHK